VVIYPAQAVDHDLYKLSVQLFRQDRDRRPSTASAPPLLQLPTATVHWLIVMLVTLTLSLQAECAAV